ncbi:MAG: sensor histidine kinase [Vulcanimicrobiota bacterium]
MEELDSLREREKELGCLYEVQRYTLEPSQSLETVLQQVVEALPPGWQRPQSAGACIEYLGREYRSSNYHPDAPALVERLELSGDEVGRVVVSDTALGFEARSDEVFLVEEQRLLRSVANLLRNFLEWRHLEVLGQRLAPDPDGSSQEIEAMVQRTLLGLSHELRNPLTVIVTDLDLLRAELPQEVRDEVITEIQQAASGLSKMVADLMLFLRAETGVEKPSLEEVELGEFVRAQVEDFSSQVTTRVVFSCDSPSLLARINRRLTARILHDLMRNGVLYANTDEIQVRVYGSAEEVIVSVKDRGRGIDKRHQERIFEQFYRLESSRDRFSGGVGLGLPLARALARSQHSALELVSEPGQGTEVRLIFKRG